MDNIIVSLECCRVTSEADFSTPTFLRQWRRHRGFTQEQLADLVGMTAPTISQLENNKQGFTGESLAKLASALGCSPAALLGYDPTRDDSLWPVLEATERLQTKDRQKILAILRVALDQFR